MLTREPSNPHDKSAVGVFKGNALVGHAPYNISGVISQFLRRDCNKGFAEVTGPRVNKGAGYGLEIPCRCKLYGPKPYTDRIVEIVRSLQQRGLI